MLLWVQHLYLFEFEEIIPVMSVESSYRIQETGFTPLLGQILMLYRPNTILL